MSINIKLLLLSQLIVFFVNLSLGLFVLRKKGITRISFYYSVFSIALAMWNICVFLTILEVWPQIVWSRLGFSFGVVLATALFYFSLIFPYNYKPKLLIRIPLIITFILLFLLTLTDKVVLNVNVENGHISGDLGQATIYYFLYSIFCILGALFILIYKYVKAKDIYKIQLFYVFFGLSIFTLAVLITQLILPIVFGIFKYNNLGPVFSLPMVALIAYAIVKHRLMDINIVIQRGLMYSFIFGLITLFYLALVFVFGYFLQKTTQVTSILSALITIVIGIYGVPVLEKYFQKATDKIFFKDKYDFSKAVYDLSKVLNCNIKLEKLLKESSLKLKEILKVKKVMFILPEDNIKFGDNEKIEKLNIRIPKNIIKVVERSKESLILHEDIPGYLESNYFSNVEKGALRQTEVFGKEYGIELSASIMLEKKMIGCLFISKKLSGDGFTDEDILLIKTFAHQSAVAIEKAKLYDQVKEYSEELEEKVRQRTAEIKNLQEEQRQMMLEIGHGLQTPLTIIKGELTFLQKEPGHAKQLKSLDKSIDRISKFIYDMLKLSRLESSENGKSKYEKINLGEFLHELIEDYEVIAKEKDIIIKEDLRKDLCIKGNKAHIDELITNLVSNSVKYMGDKKDKQIIFALNKKDQDARIIIKDTGAGIGKEHLGMIFNRFYRIQDNNKEKGTGLGLSICKRIVEMHGGRIKVESEEGQGAVVIIDLPLAQ